MPDLNSTVNRLTDKYPTKPTANDYMLCNLQQGKEL